MTADVQPLPPVARAVSQRNRERRQRQLDDVVDTASRLFAANGFGHTGMAELCDAVGMGRGQIYNLIGSKENLLKLIHERFFNWLFDGAERIRARSGSPAERLRWMMRDLLETVAAHQDDVWVFFTEWRVLGDENREEYRHRRRAYQDIFLHILDEGIESGDFVIADPHITVMGIVGMVNDSYQWFRSNGTLSPTAIADLYCDVVLNGIRVRGE